MPKLFQLPMSRKPNAEDYNRLLRRAGCTSTATAAQAIAATPTITTVTFASTAELNGDDWITPTSGTHTCPQDGVYMLMFTGALAAGNSGSVFLTVGGVVSTIGFVAGNLYGAWSGYIAAGTTITVRIFNGGAATTSTGSLSIERAGSGFM